MSETKEFPTCDVLSTVTGYLVAPNGISVVYKVLNYMTGEDVFTHQLPRICREAAPVVLALHPELAEAYAEAKQVTPDNWRQWGAVWTARYGETISVPKMSAAEHETIDPLSEAVEMFRPDNTIVVSP